MDTQHDTDMYRVPVTCLIWSVGDTGFVIVACDLCVEEMKMHNHGMVDQQQQPSLIPLGCRKDRKSLLAWLEWPWSK